MKLNWSAEHFKHDSKQLWMENKKSNELKCKLNLKDKWSRNRKIQKEKRSMKNVSSRREEKKSETDFAYDC